MITIYNKTKECDTLVKGADWAMATERELTTLARMLLGRRPVRFKGILSDFRIPIAGMGQKESFLFLRACGLKDLDQENPFDFFQQLDK